MSRHIARQRGWTEVHPTLPGHWARDGWRIAKDSRGWRWWYVIQMPLVARSPRGHERTLRSALDAVDFEIRHGAPITPTEQQKVES